MNSKEALKDISCLILQEVDNLKHKYLWKEALNIIKQDLEHLEVLKKTIEIIKKVIILPSEDDFVKVKINKNLKVEEHYYYLQIRGLISEDERCLLEEVLENDNN